jgi:hypothetical protein
VIWESNPRSLRVTTAFVAGLARLAARARINFDLVRSFRLTPGVSEEVPAVSRSSTFIDAEAQAPPLTGTDTDPTLWAPSKEPRMDEDAPVPESAPTPTDNPAQLSPRADAALRTLARLLGQQIAREHFRRSLAAANDDAASPEASED